MRVFWRLAKEFIRRPRWWFFGWLAETEIVDRMIREELEYRRRKAEFRKMIDALDKAVQRGEEK